MKAKLCLDGPVNLSDVGSENNIVELLDHLADLILNELYNTKV